MKKTIYVVLIVFLSMMLIFVPIGCGKKKSKSPDRTLNIISGSENEQLEPIMQKFAEKEKFALNIRYMGSVDIMLELEKADIEADAVLPANSIWIALGDEKQKRVKNSESIMRSPVVLGVKKSIAKRLKWIGKAVTVQDILKASEAGEIRMISTSATQSNSGAAAYIGYLYAFAGNPQMLTMKHLQDPEVANNIKLMLGNVDRSAGSSGWLKSLFIEKYDQYDAMVNYESMIIEANRELITSGKEPLYAIYPVNGLAIADSPLGYIDKGNQKKLELFSKLQEHLLSSEIQDEIQKLGRRTGLVGMDISIANRDVFNQDWGIDTRKVISPIRFPSANVIRESLRLYQTAFRKPSFTVYAIDFSGSMEGDGEKQLKDAMRILLDPNESSRYMLQPSPNDVTYILPFNHQIINEYNSIGNDSSKLRSLLMQVNRLSAAGGTDIYMPVMRAFEIFKNNKDQLENYFPAVILMTDGKSNDDKSNLQDLQTFIGNLGFNWDIPAFCITFGEADKSQLDAIAQYTSGRVFDGTQDLIGAFRHAKGYN